MFGGASMMQDSNVVYAAELEQQEKEEANKVAEELEMEATTSETPSDFLEVADSEEIQEIEEVEEENVTSESTSGEISESAETSESTEINESTEVSGSEENNGSDSGSVSDSNGKGDALVSDTSSVSDSESESEESLASETAAEKENQTDVFLYNKAEDLFGASTMAEGAETADQYNSWNEVPKEIREQYDAIWNKWGTWQGFFTHIKFGYNKNSYHNWCLEQINKGLSAEKAESILKSESVSTSVSEKASTENSESEDASAEKSE